MAEAFRATTAPLSGSIPTKAAARPGAPAPRSCELFRPLALVPVYNHPDTIAAVVKHGYDAKCVGQIERTKFYEKAANAYVTICTSERLPYGCIILQKGVM